MTKEKNILDYKSSQSRGNGTNFQFPVFPVIPRARNLPPSFPLFARPFLRPDAWKLLVDDVEGVRPMSPERGGEETGEQLHSILAAELSRRWRWVEREREREGDSNQILHDKVRTWYDSLGARGRDMSRLRAIRNKRGGLATRGRRREEARITTTCQLFQKTGNLSAVS